MRYITGLAGALLLAGLGACSNRTGPAVPPSGTGASAPAQAQLTPQNLEELMKKIGPGYQSLRKSLEGNATAEAAREAQQLAEWFGGVEKFWAQHNREDAVKFAEQARNSATEAAGAAVTGNGEKATAATTNMSAACKQCHGTYRESDGAGGYRIKPGAITGL